MSVQVTFRAPNGLISLDLTKISAFQITRQRNTCELLAITPENPRRDAPYTIARRDHEWQLKDIMNDLERLKVDTRNITFEITETGSQLVNRL